jgi:hypothetical protein
MLRNLISEAETLKCPELQLTKMEDWYSLLIRNLQKQLL